MLALNEERHKPELRSVFSLESLAKLLAQRHDL
jgi:hypothetical protein